jgi:DtxR family Mn-dependent transcriptional regulator
MEPWTARAVERLQPERGLTVNTHHQSDLIDTTEMYLRTIFELEEEGVTPLRARIAERLGQSGPTVSQTVARMERDGLVQVESDRHLQLTDDGRQRATSVMRKHRLAERLLQDVIGLEWDQLHIEACRWEHVMSEDVERRIFTLLKQPQVCPHGNPIPGLEELGQAIAAGDESHLPTLADAARRGELSVRVERISEHLQPDAGLMRFLSTAGVVPGRTVSVNPSGTGVHVGGLDSTTLISDLVAEGIFVSS